MADRYNSPKTRLVVGSLVDRDPVRRAVDGQKVMAGKAVRGVMLATRRPARMARQEPETDSDREGYIGSQDGRARVAPEPESGAAGLWLFPALAGGAIFWIAVAVWYF